MLKSVVWFITMNCQNHCPYCWERQRQKRGEFKPEPFIDTDNWINAWNKIAEKNLGEPFVLDISGGEPFMQPDFIRLLEGLHNDISIAITTNLRGNIAEFVQKISPAKVFSMTLSYHPTEMAFDVFLGKALLLKNRGFNITVNFVTWPEQMYLLPRIKRDFEHYGINLHVDPYAQTPYMPYELNEQEKGFLRGFVGIDRKITPEKQEKVLCSGGQNHLVVMPDGSAYRCVNDSIKNRKPIGNIINDEDFTLNTNRTPCSDYHVCAGCDRDKVSVVKLKGEEHAIK